jgi:hypothetical protein
MDDSKYVALTRNLPGRASALGLALGMCTVAAALADPASTGAPIVDLDSLERRLTDTRAVGLFTKLSIKNDATRLHSELRKHHDGQQPPTLAELEERYELLLQQIIVLLLDKDPDLAHAIAAARNPLWRSLADPTSFHRL